jgi:hypothetical protein
VQSDSLQAGAVIIPVKNTHTASIAKGTPVYITGNVGASERLQIAPADASNNAKMPAAGLLLTTLAVNAEGYVITGGYLRNLTTDTIDGTSTSSNDTVYVKAGGGLTMTKPTGGNLIQNIAKIARSASGNAGSLLVSSILRTNDVPNITNDYFWLGNSSGVATATSYTSRFDTAFATKDTDDLSEGTSNLYYTDARARGAISVSGNAISYNSSTGVITSNYEESPTFTGNVTINGSFTSQGIDDNADATAITINGNEEVGIGTVSPLHKLHVNSGATNIVARFQSTDSTGGIMLQDSTGNVELTTSATNGFNVQPGGGAAVFVVTGSGNVGIGITSPSKLLHLYGADATVQIQGLGTSSNAGVDFFPRDASNVAHLQSIKGVGSSLTFLTGGNSGNSYVPTERMRIDSLGRTSIIGIFESSTSEGILNLKQSSGVGSLGMGFYDGGTNPHFWLQSRSYNNYSTTYNLALQPTGGKVGIGTTSPLSLLTIRGAGDAIRVESTNTGAGGAQMDLLHFTTSPADEDLHGIINFGGNYSGTNSAYGSRIASIWTSAASRLGRLQFSTRNGANFNTVMTINHASNVGIGTTSPDSKLNINGAGAHLNFTGSNNRINFSGYRAIEGSHTGSLLQIGESYTNISLYGNVGIGTTSPSEIFHVNKNATSRIVGAYLTNSQANTGAEAVSIAFGLNRSGGDFVRKVEAIEFGATQQWTGTPSTVNSYLAFNVVKSETAYERMRVTTNGVDVTSHGAHGVHLKPDTADTNNSGRLFLTRVGGSGWAIMNNSTNFSIRSGAIPDSTSGTEKIRLTGYSATSWTSGSDETMKENIIPIGNVLDKIQNYRCVEYNFIDDETADKKIGFIAQDWQEDFPQIIEQMENEKIGMKYTETIPILLKAIQELKADNDSLKARIETLENN